MTYLLHKYSCKLQYSIVPPRCQVCIMDACVETTVGHSLSYSQVKKLYKILSEPVEINPPNNFPSLRITPANLVQVVRQRLLKKEVKLRDIRLNGSAASYCLCEDSNDLPQIQYNDIDLIFGVSVDTDEDFHLIKDEVLTSLLEFFPNEVSKTNISCQLLEETYVRTMVLVTNSQNQWSLISLGDQANNGNISIELKFVNKIKRRFEFTVDSFQIILDSYFNFDKCTDHNSPVEVSQSFFPSVQAMSVYHDFEEAMDHLNKRLIHTEAPEEIRGGGLLKYCRLHVDGFQPADQENMNRLEPYMCSRFFIDFPTISSQFEKLWKYVLLRFLQKGEGRKCLEFLDMLFNVVSCQAKCLMGSERQKTISVIMHIKNVVFVPNNLPFLPPPYHPCAINHSSSRACFNYSAHIAHRQPLDSMRTSPPPLMGYYMPGHGYGKSVGSGHWNSSQTLTQVR